MDADDRPIPPRVCRFLAVVGTLCIFAAFRYGAADWVVEVVGLATAFAWYWSGD